MQKPGTSKGRGNVARKKVCETYPMEGMSVHALHRTREP